MWLVARKLLTEVLEVLSKIKQHKQLVLFRNLHGRRGGEENIDQPTTKVLEKN